MRFFKSSSDFRAWLEKNHAAEDALLVGFYKVSSGKGGLTYQQALDEALCHGWIDGVRKSVDESRYTIRFTPRRPRSIWSRINIKRVAELTKLGLMREAGIKAFEGRDPSRARLYSNEQDKIEFTAEQEKQIRANARAWNYFAAQPPGYRRVVTWWVISAKKEETRQRRLDTLIKVSEKETRPGILASSAKRKKPEL